MDKESLTWRPLNRGDAKTSADLLNAIEVVDKIGEYYLEEDTLTELIDPYTDLERASLAAFDGDVMVGFMKVRYKASVEEVHRVLLDGGVHPAYRRRGVGTVLVEAGVAAAKAVHALHHPTAQLWIDIQKAESISGVAELVRSQGFAPVRYLQHMVCPLGDEIFDAAVPDGLRIEPWSERNDEDFRSVRNSAYQDDWVSAPVTVDGWKNKITNQTFKPEVSFLLRDVASGAAVGMLVTLYWEGDTVATGLRDAHFMQIGTLRDHRNRGVASALVAHALRAATDLGYDLASLKVDSASSAGVSGLFERAGFTTRLRHVRWALEG
jgi:mycothiol synthase